MNGPVPTGSGLVHVLRSCSAHMCSGTIGSRTLANCFSVANDGSAKVTVTVVSSTFSTAVYVTPAMLNSGRSSGRLRL